MKRKILFKLNEKVLLEQLEKSKTQIFGACDVLFITKGWLVRAIQQTQKVS